MRKPNGGEIPVNSLFTYCSNDLSPLVGKLELQKYETAKMSTEIMAIRKTLMTVHLSGYIITDSFENELGPLVIHINLLNVNEKDNYHLISLTKLVLESISHSHPHHLLHHIIASLSQQNTTDHLVLSKCSCWDSEYYFKDIKIQPLPMRVVQNVF